MKSTLDRLQGTKVLDLVRFVGSEGKTFGEMQRYIVEKTGRNYDLFEFVAHDYMCDREGNFLYDKNGNRAVTTRHKRVNRGYWCVGFRNAVKRGYLIKVKAFDAQSRPMYFANPALI